MDNPFVNTSITVDYVAILEALEAQANHADAKWRALSNATGGQLIAEYRTIGFKVGRQCGKSTALGKWVAKAPNQTLIVFANNAIEELIRARCLSKIRGGEAIRSLLPGDLRNFLRKEDPTVYSVQRVFPQGVKYILVDDADAVFNYFGVRLKDFNQWVYDTFGPEVMVIHFG